MSDKDFLLKKRSELELEYDPPHVSFLQRNTLLLVILTGVLVIVIAIGFFIVYYSLYKPVIPGVVTSSDKFAADVGWNVLQNGGNAIDAMVAMQAVLTVTESWASGIGGGAFVTYYSNKENKVHVIDGREEAPRGVGTVPSRGGGSAGIPGAIAVMARALRDYGTWDIKRCFQPAIDLARNGWILSPFAALKLEEGKSILGQFNSSRAIYFDSDGNVKKNGTRMFNPDLAKTLEILSNDWENFYTGEISNSIVDAIQKDHVSPGKMSKDDLAGYKAVEREPINFTFKGYEIYGMTMPSSGPTTISLILNMLEAVPLDWIKDGFGSFSSLQIIFSAMSLAYADRAQYMGDMDFADVPLEGLLDKKYASDRSSLINLTEAVNRANPGYPKGSPSPYKKPEVQTENGYDTSHFSIMDKDHNVVSCTTSVQSPWGSGMIVPGRGFLLNNQLTDFNINGANGVTGNRTRRRTALYPDSDTIGGKRPRSSMSPIIVFRDKLPYLAFGSPGGANIICIILNVFLNLISFNMSLSEAVSAPRYMTKNDGNWLLDKELYENQTLISLLNGVGINNINTLSEYFGGGVAIVRFSNGKLDGAVDPRKPDSVVHFSN